MKTILLLADFTERSTLAAEYALQLASDYKAGLLLFNAYYVAVTTVADGGVYPVYTGQYEEFENESLHKLESLKDHLEHAKVKCGIASEIRIQNKMGNLEEGLESLLQEHSFWMIVMGNKSKENFFSRLLFGSESYQVLKTANCPVLMINEEAVFSPFKTVTFAVDRFDKASRKALQFLIDLGSFHAAEIAVLHVAREGATDEDRQQHLDEYNSLQKESSYSNMTYHYIKHKDLPESLVHFSENTSSDLIAVVHGKQGFFHESVTKNMMKYHTVPLLIIPPQFIDKFN